MATMTKKAASRKQSGRSKKKQWEALLADVMNDISRWAKNRKWAVAHHTKSIDESELGEYQVPSLHVHTGQGTVIVEPVARHISHGDGRLDLIGLGSFKRLHLIRRDGKWALFTGDLLPWPESWNEATFHHVAQVLTEPL